MSQKLEVIIENWCGLMKVKEIRDLAKYLIETGKFSDEEYAKVFATNDERHNTRMFWFALQEKHHSILLLLGQWLRNKGYHSLSSAITEKNKGSVPFKLPDEDTEDEENTEFTSSIETHDSVHINSNTTPLSVVVNLANKFYDNKEQNPNIEFYYSRSKKRGRVLIINNYDFSGTPHEYRNGAIVDEKNLEVMFTQMGGWAIEKHSNKTVPEIKSILKAFTEYHVDKICDISCVIVMSHGSELVNKTIIYGIDSSFIYTGDIEDYFKTKECRLFKGKPKIFIYQVCRGSETDLCLKHTEVDSINGQASIPVSPTGNGITTFGAYRSLEDMLISYATLKGYKAHRDRYRGTWYIELICQTFMNLANHEPVDHLFMKVDEGLRRRMSESHSMQTSETQNMGFKKLYLNPGIYEEKGILKKF